MTSSRSTGWHGGDPQRPSPVANADQRVRRRASCHGRLRRRPPGPTGDLVATARLPAGRGRATSTTPRTFRQLWHLVERSAPTVARATVVTHRPRGNVLIRQLVGAPSLRLVTGRTDPIQGRISYHYATKVAAPVVEAVQRGSRATYLTLIVPARGAPRCAVSGPPLDLAGLRGDDHDRRTVGAGRGGGLEDRRHRRLSRSRGAVGRPPSSHREASAPSFPAPTLRP